MSAQVPGLIRWGKAAIESVVHGLTSWPDAAAESVVRGVLGLVPESERDSLEKPSSDPYLEKKVAPRVEPVPSSRFVDAEEISWLESGRHELPYRRDKLWAVPHMWWEMSFGEIGAGAYIAGAATGNKVAMASGLFLATACKGPLLWGDLGRPDRFPRVFVRPDNSWIARGAWAFAGFTVAGALSILPLPKPMGRACAGVATACAGVLGTYDGLFLQNSKGVGAWAEPTIPALFAVNGMAGGVQLANALSDNGSLRFASTVSSAAGAGLTALYASRLTQGSTAQRLSARDLLEGVQQDRFVGLGFGLGGVAASALASMSSPLARHVGAAFAFTGVAAIRRAVLEAGIHAPVIDPPRGDVNPIDHVVVSKGAF